LVRVVVTALAVAAASVAQPQSKMPHVGLLIPERLSVEASRIDALRLGLREHGYVEGKSIVLDIRSAEGHPDRLPDLAQDLAMRRVDVIVVFGSKSVSAAMRATTTIPIVDPVMGDPVAFGLADSLARPGRNVTGSVQFSPEAGAKRLELLKEAFPRVARVAVLVNPANPGTPIQVQHLRATASALKVDLEVLEVRDAKQLEATFSWLEKNRIEALIVPTDSLFRANVTEIAHWTASRKLPAIGSREFAVAGGLMGYGPDANELYRHAADFVDRILKGAKPDALPIERATRLDFIVNLKSAEAVGIAVPQSTLMRANEVIR
jgi:putative ABC transport system substrate-binding protein